RLDKFRARPQERGRESQLHRQTLLDRIADDEAVDWSDVFLVTKETSRPFMNLLIAPGLVFPLWLAYGRDICDRELPTLVKGHKTTSFE
ncbi:mCG56968, partial [Mus musculus]